MQIGEVLTMDEYIRRGAAIAEAEYDGNFVLVVPVKKIRNLPTADVAPVRHGRWIEPSRLYYGAKQYECSLCYSDTFWKKHSITEKYPHCPNCGAKMMEG